MEKTSVFQAILRSWLDADCPTPEGLYASVKSQMSARFHFSVTDTSPDEVLDWSWKCFYMTPLAKKLYRGKGLLAMQGEYRNVFHDAHFQKNIYPHIRKTVESRNPTLGVLEMRSLGFHHYCDLLVLPEKTDGKPGWLAACSRNRILSRLPSDIVALAPDDEQLVMMFANGETAKTIARELDISFRVVEHRIAALKKQLGARSLPELVTMVSASGYGKSISFT